MTHADKLAVNPLPWVIGPDGFDLSEATLRPALAELRAVGFDALHADIPTGWETERYQRFLAEYGFRPAPGYFGAAFHDRDRHGEIVEAARRHAAALARIGLTEAFVACDLVPERLSRPAQGVAASRERTAVIADALAKGAEVASAEGVHYGLHPHVGSFVETEDEVRQVLDATAGSALGFGPDVGHLLWAGALPQRVISDYADRVVALHVKDIDAEAAAAARACGADYRVATKQHHVWTEPGRGVADFTAVFAALPAGFSGWTVVEVDVPNLPSAAESAHVSRENLLAMPFFAAEVGA